MNITNQRSTRGAVNLTSVLAAIALVLVLLLAGSLYFNVDRGRQIRENERLQTQLSLIQGRLRELQQSVDTERSSRESAVAAAQASERQARVEQQQALQTAQQLKQQLADSEQQLAAAEKARQAVESQLARETKLRNDAERQIAALEVAAATTARIQSQEDTAPQPPPPLERAEPAPPSPPPPAPPPPQVEPVAQAPDADRETQAEVASPPQPETEGRETVSANQPYDVPPKPIRRSAPNYPYSLKQAGVEGSALLSFTIDAEGRVQDIEVTEATQSEFGEAAVDTVRGWRFEPARSNGTPVACRISQRLAFTVH